MKKQNKTENESVLLKPEFYDILGVPAWIFLIFAMVWSLSNNSPLPEGISIILIVIGVLGLIIDGIMVYKKFISKK